MPSLLTLLSTLTCLVSGWMAAMFLVLRHPHYLERAGLSLAICVGAATVAAGGVRGPTTLRAVLGAWGAALLALGVWALVGDVGDDGWVFVAGVIFAVQGATTLAGAWRASVSAGTT